PDRQGHIVATFPKESGYGRYRNMTPHRRDNSALILCNESHHEVDSVAKDIMRAN
ncbi:hypothetical protein BD769DRAFT_1347056, partial [Suillus cothurnatus]